MKYAASVRTVLLFCFYLLFAGAATGVVEPKRPMSPEQELRVREEARSIVVSGETFAYTFSKESGLISSVQILGNVITDGTPIPDLILAEHLDRSFSQYTARRETQARLSVASAGPAHVVVAAEGAYTAQDGRRFPLRYSITYDISIDGVILVAVRNSAVEDCTFRWLTLSGGAVKSELAKFINWMPDQAGSQSTGYLFRPLSEIKEAKILGGVWLPWIWLGDQNLGLEVTTWDVGSQTYNNVDGTSRSDQHEMFNVRREGAGVRWENWMIGGSTIYAKKGWQRGGEFALAVTPSKKFDPYYAMIKGAHLGPHQHRLSVNLPDENQLRILAQNGYNLVVGMANWRSGEYVPLNDADLRRTISLCHKFGMKVIPYITLVDLSHATAAFRDHGEEWAIEPTTENYRLTPRFRDLKVEMAYRNDPEQETTLMCPASEGWRGFWKKQIDRIISDYDFDGLYVDFWFGRMACENTRHGCGGHFRKATVLGSREMLAYAYNRIKAKNPRAILKANTNTLATSLITSVIDLRLVGEGTDVTRMDPNSRQWLYTSHRLGEPTEFLWASTRWNPAQKAGFAALINFLPQYYERPPFEPRNSFDDFDVFRFLEAEKGDWYLGISGHQRLPVTPAQVKANVVERGGTTLVTLVNTEESPVAAVVPAKQNVLVYDPLGERLLEAASGALKVDLTSGGYRHIVMTGRPSQPKLLFALGVRRPASEEWDAGARRLRFSVEGVDGARIRFAVFSPERPTAVLNGRGDKAPFEWTAESRLVRFEAPHASGERFEIYY
ncbi:MAG TPA: DUF6259 domain-containing protein [Bryobacteraceae bacterium]|nr:DUF6259 domain-containing protein [Bryobacteraceae bacterium]